MAEVFIPRWLKCTLSLQWGDQIFENTWSEHQTNPGHPTQAALDAYALALWNGPVAALNGASSNQVRFLGITVRDMTDNTGLEGSYSPVNALYGQRAIASQTLDACCVLSERTGFVGKSGRGRTYVSGMGTDRVTTNFFTNAQVVDTTSFGQALLTFAGTVLIPSVFTLAS